MNETQIDLEAVLADLSAQIGQYARDGAVARAQVAALTKENASLKADLERLSTKSD